MVWLSPPSVATKLLGKNMLMCAPGMPYSPRVAFARPVVSVIQYSARAWAVVPALLRIVTVPKRCCPSVESARMSLPAWKRSRIAISCAAEALNSTATEKSNRPAVNVPLPGFTRSSSCRTPSGTGAARPGDG